MGTVRRLGFISEGWVSESPDETSLFTPSALLSTTSLHVALVETLLGPERLVVPLVHSVTRWPESNGDEQETLKYTLDKLDEMGATFEDVRSDSLKFIHALISEGVPIEDATEFYGSLRSQMIPA